MKVSLSSDLTLLAVVQVSWYNVTSMAFFADQIIAKRERERREKMAQVVV